MSFLGGLEEWLVAKEKCTGPEEFRDQETWLRARIMVLEKRLRECVQVVADMECQCQYPGDECQRCAAIQIMTQEPTYDGRTF